MSRAGSTRSSGPAKVPLPSAALASPGLHIAAAVRPVHRRWPRGSSPGWSHQPPRGAGRSPTQVRRRACRHGRRRGPNRGRTIAPWPSRRPARRRCGTESRRSTPGRPSSCPTPGVSAPTGARPGRVGRWPRRTPTACVGQPATTTGRGHPPSTGGCGPWFSPQGPDASAGRATAAIRTRCEPQDPRFKRPDRHDRGPVAPSMPSEGPAEQ
jgi:hypothetical protein